MKQNLMDSLNSNNTSKKFRHAAGGFLAQRPQSGETPDAKPILSTFGRSVKKLGDSTYRQFSH